ncbi:MAG: hypothetical protein JSU69_10735 [Candidatus Zixiibacteriota bacterium]|nr:MAG: hypothetical protein JSU69_10735 [candidate division Zixibacteria bacterium]
MSLAQWYAIFLAVFIIGHRLPGLYAPDSQKKLMGRFCSRKLYVQGTGLILGLFTIWGIAATWYDYKPFGWFLIAISIVVLHKAVRFLVIPTRAGRKEIDSWDQSNRIIRFVCALSIAFGLFLIFFAIFIMK